MGVRKRRPVRSLREFAAEVGVIVLGVLIALGAEQLVQEMEWRSKIDAAEEAMRTELRDDNGPQAYGRYALHQCLQQRLDGIRAALESGADRATVARLAQAYKLPFWTWDSMGHDAAVASNVMTRMGAKRAQIWSIT